MQTHALKNGKHNSYSLLCQAHSHTGGTEDQEDRENQSSRLLRLSPMCTPIYSRVVKLLAYRQQVAGVPSYALTIHRSQSLSLDKVAADYLYSPVRQIHSLGAVYVALSWCKSPSGLLVRGLEHEMISTPPNAQELIGLISNIEDKYPSKVIRNTSIPMDVAEKFYSEAPSIPLHISSRTIRKGCCIGNENSSIRIRNRGDNFCRRHKLLPQ